MAEFLATSFKVMSANIMTISLRDGGSPQIEPKKHINMISITSHVAHLSFSFDNQYLAVLGNENPRVIETWSIPTDQIVWQWKEQHKLKQDVIRAFQFSLQGNYRLHIAAEHNVSVIDGDTGSRDNERTFIGQLQNFSPRGDSFALKESGERNQFNIIRPSLFAVETELSLAFPSSLNSIHTVSCFTTNGERYVGIFGCSDVSVVYVWDIDSGELQNTFNFDFIVPHSCCPTADITQVLCVQRAKKGAGEVVVLDIDTGVVVRFIPLGTRLSHFPTIDRCSNRIAIVRDSFNVEVYDIGTGQLVSEFAEKARIQEIKFSSEPGVVLL